MSEDQIIDSSGCVYRDLGVEKPWWAARIEALEAENAQYKKLATDLEDQARKLEQALNETNGKFFHIRNALEAENARLQKAGIDLYKLAIDLIVHHEAILFAWQDKASPESLAEMATIRRGLFAASAEWRDVLGETKWREAICAALAVSANSASTEAGEKP